jgi:hypothetical protein
MFRVRLTVLAFLIIPNYIVADYDVARSAPPVIQSIASDLNFDEHGRLAHLAFVYDASNPECHSMVRTNLQKYLKSNPRVADRIQLAAVEGEAFDRVLAPYKSDMSGCMAACIERGTDRDLAGYVMPNEVYDSAIWDNPHQDLSEWFVETCSKKELCLLSYHSSEHPLNVYWKNNDGKLLYHMSLNYGDKSTRCIFSYLGHQFVARDDSSDPANPKVIGELTIDFTTVKAFGESPPSDERAPSYNFDVEIEETLKYEWKRHERIKRTFSPLGFKKGKLPKDVFASLGAFYYNNAQNVVREEWTNRGVYVNWWETDVLLLQIPWHMKVIYQARLKTMVEEWAGVPVEQTVMYGLRQYTQGARLLTHVDRHATHAVSLIVNVAQGNLTEPWPIEVQDHADRLHEVLMAPGDVVYYESAKCLHGRNRPLSGPNAYYTNMFTHYKPIQEGNWWLDANPEGSPEPVLGDTPVAEECRLIKKDIVPADDGNAVGFLQGVECDNPALGKFISPDLFQATKPDDLVKWWRMTTPPSENSARAENGRTGADTIVDYTEEEL